MRKVILTVSALLVSYSVLAAAPQTLSSAMLNSIQNHVTVHAIASYPLVYGGQDFSRSRIATADESFWGGQRTLVG